MKYYNLQHFIELKFGWNKITEKINALITIIHNPIKFIMLWKIIISSILKNQKIIIFTFAMPAYADNVQSVPFLLKDRGYSVLVFEEWLSKKFPNYKLDRRYEKLHVYKDLWYMLPFLYADIIFTPTARKHIYYPINAKKINCFHSLASLNAFPKDAFKPYEVYFSSAPHQTEELIEYCKYYKLKNRIIVKAGYPKIDFMYRQSKLKHKETIFKNSKKTIFYAPTYFGDAVTDICRFLSSIDRGVEIIEILLKRYNVIFRPHPVNIKHQNIDKILQEITDKFTSNSSFFLDIEKSSEKSSLISDIMVSDISGTAFTYSLAFSKPVLFIEKQKITDEKGFQFKKRELIGDVMPISDINNINNYIEELLKDYKAQTGAKEIVYNFTKSEAAYIDNIEKFLNQKKSDTWIFV